MLRSRRRARGRRAQRRGPRAAPRRARCRSRSRHGARATVASATARRRSSIARAHTWSRSHSFASASIVVRVVGTLGDHPLERRARTRRIAEVLVEQLRVLACGRGPCLAARQRRRELGEHARERRRSACPRDTPRRARPGRRDRRARGRPRAATTPRPRRSRRARDRRCHARTIAPPQHRGSGSARRGGRVGLGEQILVAAPEQPDEVIARRRHRRILGGALPQLHGRQELRGIEPLRDRRGPSRGEATALVEPRDRRRGGVRHLREVEPALGRGAAGRIDDRACELAGRAIAEHRGELESSPGVGRGDLEAGQITREEAMRGECRDAIAGPRRGPRGPELRDPARGARELCRRILGELAPQRRRAGEVAGTLELAGHRVARRERLGRAAGQCRDELRTLVEQLEPAIVVEQRSSPRSRCRTCAASRAGSHRVPGSARAPPSTSRAPPPRHHRDRSAAPPSRRPRRGGSPR